MVEQLRQARISRRRQYRGKRHVVADAVMAIRKAAEEVRQQRHGDGEAVGEKEVLGVVGIEIDGDCGLDGGVNRGAVIG